MLGMGAGAIFEPLEQLIRAVARASSRTGTTILLMRGKLWHPAKRHFVNGRLKFDELAMIERRRESATMAFTENQGDVNV
jgi:hypothetical protein